MSTLVVVEQILRETEVPMSVREIVERAGESLPTKSKTPDTVVARDLSMDIKRKGEDSVFVRTSPGRYTMRDIWLARQREVTQGPVVASEPVVQEATPVLSSALRHERAPAMSASKKPAAAESTETAVQSST